MPLAILLKDLDLTTGEGSPDFAWLPVLVWPSFVYGLMQFFEGWVLTPWIQSESTNLSAVTILIVVLVGGVVGGLCGLILAIPIAACLKILSCSSGPPIIKLGSRSLTVLEHHHGSLSYA